MAIVTPNVQWSRFFRPKTLDDLVVGNPEILGEAKVAQKKTLAMLVVGETGTGKTTLARALAEEINGNQGSTIEEPSTERGKAYVERLQSYVKYAPSGKKWVVIVDEVHQMTKDAFTALLKLIEDPPHKNVLFILCTNHARKVPVEVIDRCKTIKIEKPELKEAKLAMIRILKQVGLKVSKEERSKLATKAVKDSDFCMRRAVEALESMHDKIVSGTPVEKVLSGKKAEGGEGEGNIGEVEKDAMFLLSALFTKEDTTDRLKFVMKKTSTVDVVLTVERMIGILYHGYSMKQGGKWNWQAMPFGKVFDGKTMEIPKATTVTEVLHDLITLQMFIPKAETLSLPALMASHLSKIILKLDK